MGQGQGVEAKKSGCSLSPLRARRKCWFEKDVMKTYLGNKYFGIQMMPDVGLKSSFNMKRLGGNMKTAYGSTFVSSFWLKIAK